MVDTVDGGVEHALLGRRVPHLGLAALHAEQRQIQALDLPLDDADEDVDVPALRSAWLAMTDTHELFGLLRTFRVGRTQALRLVGDALATRVPNGSLENLLVRVAGTQLPIMVFVGNRGVIQIYSGPIGRVVTMGTWANVLDPGFDLHVRTDRIASSWVVRKPTRDGVVTALELYDAAGEAIALLVGKRHTGEPENGAWRSMVEAIPLEAES